MSGGTIASNIALGNGGGIYLNTTGSLSLSGGSVTGNHAQNGGGMYAAAQMTLSGGTISNNQASVNGGGVYATKAVTMSLTVITGNTATLNGGGVLYNSALTTWTMNSGSISENIAHGDGGGFYGMGARMKFVMNGGTISYNLAGYEDDDEDTDLHRGGGIYMDSGIGVCSMNSGTIVGNIAIHGGGIYTKRNMNLTGGSVTENYAYDENGYATANENPPGGKGGGLYIDTTSTVNNYNSVCPITGNDADVLAYANVFCNGQYNT
jgi:predicted outer membrane repeat protein